MNNAQVKYATVLPLQGIDLTFTESEGFKETGRGFGLPMPPGEEEGGRG